MVPRAEAVEEEQRVTHAVDEHHAHGASSSPAHRIGVGYGRHVGPVVQEPHHLCCPSREGAEDAVNPKHLPQQDTPAAQKPALDRRPRMRRYLRTQLNNFE